MRKVTKKAELYRRNDFGKRIQKVLCLWCFIILFAVSMKQKCAAETEDPIQRARAGIVRVQAFLSDSRGNKAIKSQTGFLLGDESGASLVVTVYHGICFSDQERNQYAEEWKTEEGPADLQEPVYEIIQNGDIHTQVELFQKSEQKDLAILSLSNRAFSPELSLTLETEEQPNPAEVHLLAFPQQETEGNAILYTKENVQIYEGTLEHLFDENETGYLRYRIVTEEVCDGGPILNDLGNVIGIQVRPGGEGMSDAVSVKELRQMLDQEKITYRSHVITAAEARKISKWVYVLGGIVLLFLVLYLWQQIRFASKMKKLRKTSPGSPVSLQKETSRILRIRTRETIPVTSSPFYLGSSPEKVQYCIQDNKKVSRLHACIACRKGHYYLVDLGSSNGTTLEGKPLESRREYELVDGMKFCLFDEEFVFRSAKKG